MDGTVGDRVFLIQLRQILTDFRHSLTGTLRGKFSIWWSFKNPAALWTHRYATLWNINARIRLLLKPSIHSLKLMALSQF